LVDELDFVIKPFNGGDGHDFILSFCYFENLITSPHISANSSIPLENPSLPELLA
jgi:hypothetical protein